jgi:hypothetical protein
MLTTDDLGLAIRDFLENRDICHFDPEGLETGDKQKVDFIDVSDASNPVVMIDSGIVFQIRIFRKA